ncbi:beta galactosidase jelly roll domain-containing protein [Vibrio cholerae]
MNKPEYPRPQFVRESWQSLNGQWQFDFDDDNKGHDEEWYKPGFSLSNKIEVPFVYQAKASGIGAREPHEYVWYKRQFTLSKSLENQKVLLHFGAVDYQCWVFVNGQRVGEHQGGNTSFFFDITHALKAKSEQEITVAVYDPCLDETIPRGKQIWGPESRDIWYTNSTGIWQSVWLESVNPNLAIDNIFISPDLDHGKVNIEARFSGNVLSFASQASSELTYYLETSISFKQQQVVSSKTQIMSDSLSCGHDVVQKQIFRTAFHDEGWSWTPETPNLFDVTFKLVDSHGNVIDKVDSYFGMRKIHTENGMVYLNNKPYYQKLVLDQGYWPDGLMTAPDDEALKQDILLSKQMGFNGCRKHQKVEEARFLYWADKLGYLVWGECAASPMYDSNAVARLTQEWLEIIERDYNHPSLVTWVPLNESWGVPNIARDRQQQHHSQAMYHLIHSLDNTRLVISNDGWEITESDICAVHNYQHGTEQETSKYARFCHDIGSTEGLLGSMSARRSIYANGFAHQGEPIILTEFGGVGFKVGDQEGWGYTSVTTAQGLIDDLTRIMKAIKESKALHGYCYTQLCDVEQEINGLLTYDRKPKCDLSIIHALNEQVDHSVI